MNTGPGNEEENYEDETDWEDLAAEIDDGERDEDYEYLDD